MSTHKIGGIKTPTKSDAGQETSSTESTLFRRLAPVFVLAAIVAVYSTVFSVGLIYLDDELILRQRFFIINSLTNLPLAFTTDAFLGPSGSIYRPLQTVSFMLEAAVGGSGPFIFHLTSVALHVLTSLLLYWLFLTMGYRHSHSLFITILYAVHPVFVSTIAWIPSRGDQLLAVFSLLSVILFIRYLRSPHPGLPYVHGMSFLLAFLAKETGVVVPFICVAYYLLDKSRKTKTIILRQYAVIWMVVAAIWYILRSQLQSSVFSTSELGIQAFITNLQIIPETFGKFFFPVNLRLIPQFNAFDTAVGLATIVLVLFAINRSASGFSKRVLFGLLWFLLFTAPVLSFRNMNAEYYFDYLYHRSYIANIGLVIVILELLRRTRLLKRTPRLIAVGASILLVCLGIRTFIEVPYFHDPISFYTEAMKRSPRSALCYNNRGAFYKRERFDYSASIADFDNALRIFPAYVQAFCNRGESYQRLGKLNLAAQDYESALRINPLHSDAIYLRGNLRFDMNNYTGALKDFDRVIAANLLYPRIWSAKAGCLAMLGRQDEAIEVAEKAISFNPKDEQAYNSRGLAKWLKNDPTGAMTDYMMALEINPEYSRAYNNRGAIYFSQGKLKTAEKDFSRAIDLDSSFASAYNNRGFTRRRLGERASALYDLSRAIEINPDYANAYVNRGGVLNDLERYDEAFDDFSMAIKLNPGDFKTWQGRGISRYMLHDRAGACSDWQEAQRRGSPDSAELLSRFCR